MQVYDIYCAVLPVCVLAIKLVSKYCHKTHLILGISNEGVRGRIFGSTTVLQVGRSRVLSQWPRCLRCALVVASFLGLRVRIPPGHQCLCCVVYSKDKVTSQDNQDKETSVEKVQRERKKGEFRNQRQGVLEIFY